MDIRKRKRGKTGCEKEKGGKKIDRDIKEKKKKKR